jgi:hypothetical protein
LNQAVDSVAFNNRAYTFTGLTNGVEYDFTVSAANAAGSSSAFLFQCRACQIPSMPLNLRENTSFRTASTLGATWDAVNNGAVGVTYTITTSFIDINGQTRQGASAGIFSTSYDHGNLTPGKSYQMTVKAVNVCGESRNTAPLTLISGTCPDAPSLVRTTNQADQTITCSWTEGNANGFTMSGHQVSIANSFGVYTNVAQYCSENQANFANNGNLNIQSVAGNTCTIPESYLRSAPFNLGETAAVSCQVVSVNTRCSSTATIGNGALMPILARAPDAPTIQFV